MQNPTTPTTPVVNVGTHLKKREPLDPLNEKEAKKQKQVMRRWQKHILK